MRRATNPTRKISITIPESIFERLKHTLSYDQSRSKYIANAIEAKLDNEEAFYFDEMGILDLLAGLEFKFPKDSAEDIHVQALIKLCRNSKS